VIGVSHQTAPLSLRERLAVAADRMPAMLKSLRDEDGLDAVMVVSTSHRVEVYGRGEEGVDERALEWFVSATPGPPREELAPCVYRLTGAAAIRHAFRVAASLEALVLGEPQILGQVKDAYQAAEQAGTLGSSLNALRNRSLAAAKRARTETGIGRNAVSISYVAVELARKIFASSR